MPGMSLQMSCSTGNVAHSGEADAAAAQARENVQPGMLGIMAQRDSTPAAAVAAGMVKSAHAAPGSAMHAGGAVVGVVAVDVVVVLVVRVMIGWSLLVLCLCGRCRCGCCCVCCGCSGLWLWVWLWLLVM